MDDSRGYVLMQDLTLLFYVLYCFMTLLFYFIFIF